MSDWTKIDLTNPCMRLSYQKSHIYFQTLIGIKTDFGLESYFLSLGLWKRFLLNQYLSMNWYFFTQDYLFKWDINDSLIGHLRFLKVNTWVYLNIQTKIEFLFYFILLPQKFIESTLNYLIGRIFIAFW